MGPFYGVLKDLGVRGGKLRELHDKGYTSKRQQLPPALLVLGLPYEVLGPRTRGGGGGTARWPWGHGETQGRPRPLI